MKHVRDYGHEPTTVACRIRNLLIGFSKLAKDKEHGKTYWQLASRMMANVASTALDAYVRTMQTQSRECTNLFNVIIKRSPRFNPRYTCISSPPQSNSFSRGIMDRKHTAKSLVVATL